MKKHIHILKEIPLFNSIDEDDIFDSISSLDGYKKEYEKNQIIYNFLDKINYGGVVLEGEIDMTMLNSSGNEYAVKKFVKGDVFGDAYACIPSTQSAVQIITHRKSEILFLRFSNLFLSESVLCPYTSQITKNLLMETAKNNIFQDMKIQILIQKHIRDKLIIYLSTLDLADNIITLPFNRQGLADYLAVDRSALSRELSRMKKEGLIDYHRNKLYILKETLLYESSVSSSIRGNVS